MDVTADYLRSIYRYFQWVLESTYGKEFIDSQTLSYVITVPALWTDTSKAMILRAANNAGLNGKKVELVTESEAAALYCGTICDEVDLHVGSKFVGEC